MKLQVRTIGLVTVATVAMAAIAAVGAGPASAATQDPVKVTIYAAGTLAGPFREMAREFEKSHPDIGSSRSSAAASRWSSR